MVDNEKRFYFYRIFACHEYIYSDGCTRYYLTLLEMSRNIRPHPDAGAQRPVCGPHRTWNSPLQSAFTDSENGKDLTTMEADAGFCRQRQLLNTLEKQGAFPCMLMLRDNPYSIKAKK